MKTICIENHESAAIGGGIRLLDDDVVYSTMSGEWKDPISAKNIKRFGRELCKLGSESLVTVLQEKNNIQIVDNRGSSNIPGMYRQADAHDILSKTGIIKIFSRDLSLYLPPVSMILPASSMVSDLCAAIEEHFHRGDRIVIKHAKIDGNGNGVDFLEYDTLDKLKRDISLSFNKFISHIGNIKEFAAGDILLQKYIDGVDGEGSITFSIQNDGIENRGMANNITNRGEYFASTNYFPFLSADQKINLEEKMYRDFLPILKELQAEGVRGNVGFDLLIKNNKGLGVPDVYIMECNGIYRTTGSSLPNSFAYNTKNNLFLGIPLNTFNIAPMYAKMDSSGLSVLANHLESIGKTPGKPQIMNIKTEGKERGYPCSRIVSAGNTIDELFYLFKESGILSQDGDIYVDKIFLNIKKDCI